MTQNSIMSIEPYNENGLWAFDDAKTGLMRELFVAGIDTMLDMVSERLCGRPFTIIFGAVPFPGHEIVLEHTRGDGSGVGNFYFCKELGVEGWLCPALFKYFEKAPAKIYAQFKPREAVPTKQPKRK